mmetsp:Transcript_66365/g.171600  ORF Transcript_66365/g.171600 Transcript_66365/m.171600 type:complete len:333 (-) Transcript_66365:7-1005(-)
MADGDEEEVQGEESPVVLDPVELTEDLMTVSQVGKTVDGTGFAFFQLDCTGKQIGDINALQQYKHLRQIDMSNNLIKDLSPLASLGHVLKLNLAKNGIESLQPVLGLRHLLYLDVSGNALTELPALPMPSLKRANFSGNKIASCSSFKGHAKLQFLDLGNNEIQDLEGVAGMPELQTLNLAQNKLSSIIGLGKVDGLLSLDLSQNQFDSLAGPFDILESLVALNVSQNKIDKAKKLESLVRLRRLKTLQVKHNPLEEEAGVNIRLEVLLFQKEVLEINGEPVTADERSDAKALKDKRIEEDMERIRQEEEARLAAEEVKRQAEEEARIVAEA